MKKKVKKKENKFIVILHLLFYLIRLSILKNNFLMKNLFLIKNKLCKISKKKFILIIYFINY